MPFSICCTCEIVFRPCHVISLQDPPLTELGLWQARETSSSLHERGVRLTHIYCSPALRCVQTALEVLRGMELVPMPRAASSTSTAGVGDDVVTSGGPVIRIEPGLFEWLGWYKNGLPNFMTAEQLHTQRYPVDITYRPVHPIKQFNMNESIDQYFERSYRAVKTVLDSLRASAATESGAQQTVFFIAHAGSLDTCTRLLLKRDLRSNKQIFKDIGAPRRPLQSLSTQASCIAYANVAHFDWRVETLSFCTRMLCRTHQLPHILYLYRISC